MSETTYKAVRLDRDELAQAFDRGECGKVAGHIAALEHENANLSERVRRLKVAVSERDRMLREAGHYGAGAREGPNR